MKLTLTKSDYTTEYPQFSHIPTSQTGKPEKVPKGS